MPTILKTKNSVTTTVVPTTLQQGELAVNITDKKLWVGNAATTPVQLLGAGVTGDVVGPASSTDNAVARFDGTTGKIIQNSAVTIADTTGDITTAGYLITAAGAVGTPALTTTGDTNTGIFFPAADTIAFTEGGAESMRIDSSGQVGIGVTAPTAQLATLGNVNIGNNSSTNPFSYLRFGGSQYSASDIRPVDYGGHTSGLAFYTDGTADTTINPTERMRIDSSGNCGIGTSSPSGRLDVVTGQNYNSRFFNNAGGNTDIYVNTSAVARDWLITRRSNGEGWLYMSGADPIVMYTNGTERMRITSGGDLCVGKTTASDSVVGAYVLGSGAINSTLAGSTNATSSYILYSTGASAFRFYVQMDGKVNATNTTIAAISDQRLKENIQDIDVGLNAVMALKPRKFDWKAGKGKDIKGDRGWIAQEFEQVFPEMIGTWKDEPPEGEEPYKSVCADLIPVLTKAIQEQQALIENLTTRLNALEGK
jgi:hypothetical protein